VKLGSRSPWRDKDDDSLASAAGYEDGFFSTRPNPNIVSHLRGLFQFRDSAVVMQFRTALLFAATFAALLVRSWRSKALNRKAREDVAKDAKNYLEVCALTTERLHLI
jgi:hypothetical protein